MTPGTPDSYVRSAVLQANSVRPGPTSTRRSRAAIGRRDAILDATLAVAATGGYDAVHMRAVAERVGIAVGTLYRYFPSKTRMLVAALTREFQRLDASCDWTAIAPTPQQRLGMLTARLHEDWQRQPELTEAMTRAFLSADTSATSALTQAASVIEDLFVRALGGGETIDGHRQVAGLITDVWLANLAAFVTRRASATQTRDHIDRAVRLLLCVVPAPNSHLRYC